MTITRLGICADGRALSYDSTLYEFRLGGQLVTYADVRELDAHAHIGWRAAEQRDWFHAIVPADLRACNERALARLGADAYSGMTPEERVAADAARDDSVLAGKIVDADPALVQAVVAALEEQGLIGAVVQPGQPYVVNPLAAANLPKGMEALSQLERAQGAERKMTGAEKRLMNKILRNDDKAKAKREKQAERAGRERAKERFAEEQAAERERGSTDGLKGKVVSDAINAVAANPEHSRFGDVVSGDARDAQAASHGYNPDVAQTALSLSVEEQALKEMRERNRRDTEREAQEAAGVPGAKAKPGGGLFARFLRNADGSPKNRGKNAG